ncbi:hypothetical protein LTV02_16970 [Nocardia yamanashiensis]|uniref:hypothetical protein n=1 Tax=Nocardia yamanashiensis TaxID=209247 RepID=UPI001E2DBC7A|nr:hypothetical protein [Nocardia yamanashiensis]UGT44983.1 hypothetical protein LTV02_16970 [Nocardia yamanashiensis]
MVMAGSRVDERIAVAVPEPDYEWGGVYVDRLAIAPPGTGPWPDTGNPPGFVHIRSLDWSVLVVTCAVVFLIGIVAMVVVGNADFKDEPAPPPSIPTDCEPFCAAH